MTPESKRHPGDPGLVVLLGAALAAVGVGILVVALGAALGGRSGALGAAIGAGLVITVLALGSFVVHVVAAAMPSASLLVALLTYALQIAVMAAVFVSLDRSGDLGPVVDREWLAGGVIAGTLVWVAAQTWLSTKARIPLYDLPQPAPSSREEVRAR
jgi:ATP synthase protein I